jgi:hypothetical protein
MMTTEYRPTHKFMGQNAVSIEYELRKLAQTLSSHDAAIEANRLGIFGKRD